MIPTDQVRWRAWGQTRAHARRVAAAADSIRQTLVLAPQSYISFSGGKDSTVLLHLVRSQAPDLPVVWSDAEWEYPETVAFVDATATALAPGQLLRFSSVNTHTEGFTSWDSMRPWLRQPHPAMRWEDKRVWGQRAGMGAVFLGLRAEESRERRLRLKQAGPLAWVAADQMGHANPLAWWSVDDVWAYLLTQDVAYNPVYDILSGLGIAPRYQRVGPLAQRRVLGYGSLATLQRGWPELFNRLAALWPEARAYT